jgi:hypothetical protein
MRWGRHKGCGRFSWIWIETGKIGCICQGRMRRGRHKGCGHSIWIWIETGKIGCVCQGRMRRGRHKGCGHSSWIWIETGKIGCICRGRMRWGRHKGCGHSSWISIEISGIDCIRQGRIRWGGRHKRCSHSLTGRKSETTKLLLHCGKWTLVVGSGRGVGIDVGEWLLALLDVWCDSGGDFRGSLRLRIAIARERGGGISNDGTRAWTSIRDQRGSTGRTWSGRRGRPDLILKRENARLLRAGSRSRATVEFELAEGTYRRL